MTMQSGGPAALLGQRRRSFAEMRERARRAASGLRDLGVGPGACVALFLRNDFAFLEASMAANFLGAYPVPINWHAAAPEIAHILADCGAKALIVHDDLFSGARGGMPAGLPVCVVQTPPEIRNAYGLSEGIETLTAAPSWDDWANAQPLLADMAPANRAAIIYTSGTTGRPKGVRRGDEQGARAPTGALTAFGFETPEPKTVLINGPMYHSAPNAYARLAMQAQADIVLQPRFGAEELLSLIEMRKITHMHAVPTMFVRLLRLPEPVRRRYDLSSLRHVVHGAAPCPIEIKRAMIAWWGPVIYEYYGSTETGLAAWHTSEDALRRPGTVGRALPNVRIAILDEAGNELPCGEVGEVYVHQGELPDFTYIGMDDARAEIGRGSLVTVGDMGWLDEEGFLFLCDRKRDMIISGGVNIYPAEIEAALLALPAVADCAVFGIPDEEFGEAICAYVQKAEAAMIDAAGLREQLRAHLSAFKVPKVIEFVDTLPREDSGKVFKRKLRAPYWAKAGELPVSQPTAAD